MHTHDLEVTLATIPAQKSHAGNVFPHVLECQSKGASLDETVEWVEAHHRDLIAQAAEHGAVLFRGFPLAAADDFDAFVTAFDLPNFPYDQSLSNAVRINWTERVFSANEAPSDVAIYLHHEMAQTPIFPENIFFFCQQPADEGGETPICRSDWLFERLAEECPQFVADCEKKGVVYTNVMPSENDAQSGMGRSWRSTLHTDTREQAEQRLKTLQYSWEWLPDGCLRATTPVLPAVREVSPGAQSVLQPVDCGLPGMDGQPQRPVEVDLLWRWHADGPQRRQPRYPTGREVNV